MRLLRAIMCAAAVLYTPFAAGAQDGPWQIRFRAIDVAPDESSTVSIGGQANVDSAIMPELDITYFFNENFAAELILATSQHNVTATGTALGNLDLGDVWVLPPTLTFQYHMSPGSDVRPYVGAGINYTIFYGDDPTDVGAIKYDDGFGFALQAGVDIQMNDTWFFNLDAKKLWLNTDVDIGNGAASADVDLDPWVFGIGFGRRF